MRLCCVECFRPVRSPACMSTPAYYYLKCYIPPAHIPHHFMDHRLDPADGAPHPVWPAQDGMNGQLATGLDGLHGNVTWTVLGVHGTLILL